jgi:hypothetical protein
MVFKNGTEKFLVLALLISRWFVLTSVPEQSPGLRSPAVKINTVFFWYLMHRLNTRELLQRRNFLITYDMCVLWLSPVVETRTHLFFHCTFARACRNYISPNWDPPSDNIHGIVDSPKQALRLPCILHGNHLFGWLGNMETEKFLHLQDHHEKFIQMKEKNSKMW